MLTFGYTFMAKILFKHAMTTSRVGAFCLLVEEAAAAAGFFLSHLIVLEIVWTLRCVRPTDVVVVDVPEWEIILEFLSAKHSKYNKNKPLL